MRHDEDKCERDGAKDRESVQGAPSHAAMAAEGRDDIDLSVGLSK
jgi:hypothetical protein